MFIYKDIQFNDLMKLEKFWNKNSKYHTNASKYFSSNSHNTSFNNRLTSWKKAEYFKSTIALFNNKIIGYIVSTINNGTATIESLYVEEKFRENKVGTNLVNSHLSWFKDQKCGKISVTTVYPNESTIEFYKSLGFFPKTISLEMK